MGIILSKTFLDYHNPLGEASSQVASWTNTKLSNEIGIQTNTSE